MIIYLPLKILGYFERGHICVLLGHRVEWTEQ